MSKLTLLNFLGKLDYEVVKLSDLTIDQKLQISQFRAVETVYGRRVLVVFDDGKAVWLPERFKDLLDEYLEGLNKGKKVVFIYRGKRKITSGRDINDIEFQFIE